MESINVNQPCVVRIMDCSKLYLRFNIFSRPHLILKVIKIHALTAVKNTEKALLAFVIGTLLCAQDRMQYCQQ